MNKILEFIIKPNKWFRSFKIVTFNASGNFVFVEKDVFEFIFKNLTKVTSSLFVKFKSKIGFYEKKINAFVNYFFNNKSRSNIKIIPKFKALINFSTQSLNDIKAQNKIKPTLRVIYNPRKASFNFNQIAKNTLLTKLKGRNKFKLEISSNAFIKMNITSAQNLFYTNFNKYRIIIKIHLKSKNNLVINNDLKPSINFKSAIVPDAIILKSKAEMYVYRPTQLHVLYPDKLESWYDQTLEDVFYGQELF